MRLPAVAVLKHSDLHAGRVVALQMFRELDFRVDRVSVSHPAADEPDHDGS